ncbi:UDP-N-acetylglucosamine 2-epimerase (non-hydrolyzing) [Salinimicrobium sp. TH3]|nr:UDP-N-acetylglucosamine 2-epimerase (non-hydrolyzing) [Salinimicrobium sp. TH3]
MKILLCFGTRPEAIKMAPVVHELQRRHIDFKICVTAQHREMLDQVLDFFGVIPDYDLDLMKSGQSLNGLSANIFSAIDKVFDHWLGVRQCRPDDNAGTNIVLVHGDTTTSSMVALAAFHKGIKVGHVEAGLRTYNKKAPFPEEMNRQLTARIADYHFAPTANAKSNLLNEQILNEQILFTGNTVVDALHWAVKRVSGKALPEEIRKIQSLLDVEKKFILVTGHRRESFGTGLEEIAEALLELSLKSHIEIVFPVHLNPKVKEPVHRLLAEKRNIHLIPPVSYPAMLWLMQRAVVIISDSGGIQEEAPAFGKPVLVTRKVSERMEGVEAGLSILVGTDKKRIVDETSRLLQNPPNLMEKQNPYGDGKAAWRIVEFLKSLD